MLQLSSGTWQMKASDIHKESPRLSTKDQEKGSKMENIALELIYPSTPEGKLCGASPFVPAEDAQEAVTPTFGSLS